MVTFKIQHGPLTCIWTMGIFSSDLISRYLRSGDIEDFLWTINIVRHKWSLSIIWSMRILPKCWLSIPISIYKKKCTLHTHTQKENVRWSGGTDQQEIWQETSLASTLTIQLPPCICRYQLCLHLSWLIVSTQQDLESHSRQTSSWACLLMSTSI